MLRVHAVDDHVAFSKLVVYTRPRRHTHLGPVTSSHTARSSPPVVDGCPADVDRAPLDAVARELYRTRPSDVPPHRVVYAEPPPAGVEREFAPAHSVAQTALGPVLDHRRADGTKDVLAGLGSGVFLERDGVLAIEAESALAGTRDAHLTTSLEDHPRSWTHTQAETNGSGGLAMHVDARGLLWADPLRAPGMHYRVRVATAGTYRVWLLVKHDSDDDDSCWIALDGTPQPLDAQFWGGDLFTFATTQVWCWTLLTDLEVGRGEHVLSVLARKSRLRIDRIYLTTGDERPPADPSWRSSARLAEQ